MMNLMIQLSVSAPVEGLPKNVRYQNFSGVSWLPPLTFTCEIKLHS